MFVTLVAVLCNGQLLCLKKGVTNSTEVREN
jgi:hypothetical protein